MLFRSCPTPPPPNNTSKRHTDMQTKIGIFISSPHHCECVGGMERITRVGGCKQKVWMEETCKQRSSRPECDVYTYGLAAHRRRPSTARSVPTTPHHSTVQHSHHKQTHTFTPQQASMPSQTKPHRNRHKNQQHHREPSTHLPRCARAGTSSCSSPSSFLHLCLSLSLSLLAYTCSFHSSNTISCPTPPPPNNTSKRHTDMQKKIGIFISPPSSL